MNDSAHSVITAVYGTNDHFLTRSLEGLDEAHAKSRLGAEGNPISWILGHIVYWRQELLTSLGGPILWDHEAAAGYRGTSREVAASDDVEWSELVRLAPLIHAEFMTRLASADLADSDLRKMLCGLASHEGYHIGQIGIGRRVLGLEPAL